MSKDLAVFELLSHTADDQLVTVFGECYSRLIQHFESGPEGRSRSISVCERLLNLECLPNAQLLGQLTRICTDFKLVYVANVSKINQLVAQTQQTVGDQYCPLLAENCQLLSCIRDALGKVDCHQSVAVVQPLILDIVSMLSATFEHCNDHSHFYASAPATVNENLNNLFKVCTQLLFQCLDLVDSVTVDEDADVQRMNAVLEAAFSLGTLLSNLELKAMAQLWKLFMSLLQKHSAALRDRFDVRRAIRYFCAEVGRRIDTVYEAGVKSRAVTLKVLNFLLKVVLKLCDCFGGRLLECLPDLCALISSLYRNSGACAKFDGRSVETAAEIETSLLPAVDPLISALMKEDGFLEYFLEVRKSDVSALLLLSVILQKLVLSPPELLECRLFEAVFRNISTCSTELHFDVRIAVVLSSLQLPQEVYLYDALLVHTASLILCAVAEQHFQRIEKLLITHLLESAVGMKLFVCDLWCVLVRYGSSELCFEHAKLLATLSQQIHRQKAETVVIRSLLRRFCKFLSRAQQQKLVGVVSNDWSTLVQVVHPKMNCNLSVLYESFVANAWERIRESSTSSVIGSQDVDLLLQLRVGCHLNETAEFQRRVEQFLVSAWSQAQNIQPGDCGLLLSWLQHLVMVSQKYTLPHGATLPVVERLLRGECVFLKLLVLDVLKCLGARKADDLDADEFGWSVSSLFRTLLMDSNVLVRERAVETFAEFSHQTAYESIPKMTVAEQPELARRVMQFLQNRVDPGCAKSCDHFVKGLLNRPAKVRQPADTSVAEIVCIGPQPKKIKLELDFEAEMIEIESRLKLVSRNLNCSELSATEKNVLKRVLETADGLRRHL